MDFPKVEYIKGSMLCKSLTIVKAGFSVISPSFYVIRLNS